MQGDGAVAALRCLEVLYIVVALGGAVVPLVLAASRRAELAGLRIVDGQMQGDGAVAALRCLGTLYIVVALGVGAVVPLVRLQAVALNSLVLG